MSELTISSRLALIYAEKHANENTTPEDLLSLYTNALKQIRNQKNERNEKAISFE